MISKPTLLTPTLLTPTLFTPTLIRVTLGQLNNGNFDPLNYGISICAHGDQESEWNSPYTDTTKTIIGVDQEIASYGETFVNLT